MNTIESLKELYVKLGGSLEDVENKTTIPEMIDAITEVAGGSEPTYETVAEISVGEMQPASKPINGFVITGVDLSSFHIEDGETYYFNTEDNGSSETDVLSDGAIIYFNIRETEGDKLEVIDSSKDGYVVSIIESRGAIFSTTDLSNTTVRILKKVEQGGDLPENVKPTYEFGFEMTSDGQGNFTVTADEGVTFAALKSALAETPLVFAMCRHNGQLSRILIQSDNQSKIESTAIIYAGNNAFLALDISITADDTITTTAKTLT